ncbi:MAG: carbohydrate-binding domain-containing protein [Lachnospiraceae bacterium]|nr:carbohydrate-binding domain-containing protein [Lachnospiraceae bacterium]
MLMTSKCKKTFLTVAIALILTLTSFSYAGLGVIESYAADNTFTFSDSGITTSTTGDGYSIDGTTLTITASGTYKITGSCNEGQVEVNKGVTDVTLILNNLSLTCSTSAPIVIKKECSVTINVEGTNTLTDAENPDNEDSTDTDVADAFEGAAIKVKSNSSLILTGSGTLNVDGSVCKNGIKGAESAAITIESGTYNVSAANNSIASDGSLIINGGTINVTSGNDGLKSKPDEDDTTSAGTVTINGGTITIDVDGEGIEGETVNINGGTINIKAADDGINAATERSVTDLSINITGGSLYVDSDCDGLDSNGTINVSGGTTNVFSSTQNDNCAIDYGDNSTWTITGGIIIGVGTSGMATTPTSGTYVAFGSSGMGVMGGMPASSSAVSISAGNSIVIKDSSGNTIYSVTAVKNANHVVFSSPDITSGESYSLYINDSLVTSSTATTGNGSNGQPSGNMQPGANGQPSGNMQPGANGQPSGNMQPGANGQPSGNMQQPSEKTTTDTTDNDGSTSASTSSDSDIQTSDYVSMYRMYNPNSGEHFYTSNETERNNLINAGWRYEGVAWNAPKTSDTPVYRLYNPNAGDHHYTTSISERDYLVELGWKYEGIGWYSDSDDGQQLYRLYNPNAIAGAHHYTTSEEERDKLISLGWRYEGIAWYGGN